MITLANYQVLRAKFYRQCRLCNTENREFYFFTVCLFDFCLPFLLFSMASAFANLLVCIIGDNQTTAVYRWQPNEFAVCFCRKRLGNGFFLQFLKSEFSPLYQRNEQRKRNYFYAVWQMKILFLKMGSRIHFDESQEWWEFVLDHFFYRESVLALNALFHYWSTIDTWKI